MNIKTTKQLVREPTPIDLLLKLINKFLIWFCLIAIVILNACQNEPSYVTRFSYDNSLYFEEYHLNGELHGVQKIYDAEKKLVQTLNYDHGRLNGPAVWYNQNGDTGTICSYVNDKIEGKYLVYNRNGGLIQETNYNKGQPNGIEILYYDNGMVKDSGLYDMGVKRGLWCRYDSLHLFRFCEMNTGHFP